MFHQKNHTTEEKKRKEKKCLENTRRLTAQCFFVFFCFLFKYVSSRACSGYSLFLRNCSVSFFFINHHIAEIYIIHNIFCFVIFTPVSNNQKCEKLDFVYMFILSKKKMNKKQKKHYVRFIIWTQFIGGIIAKRFHSKLKCRFYNEN